MKKFTKLFLSCMAVSALTAAVATSAMAADTVESKAGTNCDAAMATYTYGESGAAGTLAVDATKLTGGVKDGTQMTILVYKGKEADTITDANIDAVEYIDQAAGAANFGSSGKMGLKNDDKVPAQDADEGAVYTVKVGYYNSEEAFTVASTTLTFGKVATYLVGDANMSGDISSNDASTIIQHVVHLNELTGDALSAADANESGDVSSNDATAVIQYVVQLVDRDDSPIGKNPQ